MGLLNGCIFLLRICNVVTPLFAKLLYLTNLSSGSPFQNLSCLKMRWAENLGLKLNPLKTALELKI
jgi:hypothetical protein